MRASIPIPRHNRATGVAAALALAAVCLIASGCTLMGAIGGMAASFKRTGSHNVTPKYTGLSEKSFAVIVAADRSIQADYPGIVSIITREVSKILSEHTAASGMLPPDEVLRYQSAHPDWFVKSPDDLVKVLGVDRVIYIDLRDFSLTDPGNPYIYNGVAGGTVQVYESESRVATEAAFTEAIRVQYPDQAGLSPQQVPRSDVLIELSRRFVERSAWLFYEHEEANVIKY